VTTDPRLAVIRRRLADVRRIVAVTGGKGGIGKSLIASTLAASMARCGRAAGLLDLDLTGPCDHLILGAETGFPDEQFGIEPPSVHGVRFMSVASFGADVPVPLRGSDVSNALIELLAITRWGELDVLVVDMPPGLGDATLDTIRLIDGIDYLVVTTPSLVVRETVWRTLRLLSRTGSRISGVVENMARDAGRGAEGLARKAGVAFLGSLPYDDAIEPSLGNVDRLLATGFGVAVGELAARLVERSTDSR